MNPLVYANYPIDGTVTITERNIERFGLLPVRAINLNNSYVQYDLPIIYQRDFVEIRNKVIPLYINKPNPLPGQVHQLMFYGFPIVPEGQYKLQFDYILPGKTTPNSSYTLDLNLNFSE